MKKLSIFIGLFLLLNCALIAQVGIKSDNSAPDNSSMLDVKATNKGVLWPRMTKSQRDAIVSPANGLIVFCTNCGTDGALSFYSNGAWRNFLPCVLAPPATGTHVVSQNQIIWNWLATSGATGYKWSIAPVYETATDMGANLSKTETGTSCNNTYTRYIWAYSGCGESGMTTLTQTIPATVPASPTTGTHVPTQTSIVWNWSSVTNATGYKWNTTNNYATATDMGTAITKTESCLAGGTSYTRYVWAHNSCGYSPVVTLNQATTLPVIQAFEGTFPPTNWLRYSGLLANPSTLTSFSSGWIQGDWRNITSPVNKAARINIYGTSCQYWLTTPPINLGSGSVNYQMEFDMALTSYATSGIAGTTGTDDKFAIVISTDGGVTWTSTNTLRLWNNTGSTYVYNNISNSGEHITIPLTGYSGIVKLAFYGESTVSNADNDLFVDNVVIQESPSCFVPTAIVVSAVATTTATISWTAASPDPANGYNYEVRTSGSGGSGSTGLAISGSTSAGIVTANIALLSPSVTYYVYVRSNCGLCSYSLWVGPVSFTTVCGAAIVPFTESFNSETFAPACWTNVKTAGTGTPGTWDRQTVGTYPVCNPHSGAGMARYNSYSWPDGTTGILVTPLLNIPGDQYQVKFWMYRDDGYNGTADLVNVYYNTNPNTTGATLLGTVNRNYLMAPAVATANQWYEFVFNMPAGTSGNAYIIFKAVSAYGNDIFVDDVSVNSIGSFSCGSSITINHVAGNVAPVSKTVTYGTVTNIPGETSKCWITRNLGASQQATAVNDATEASAGWYWQFNRMQGYKHDGTNRTPNTAWINPIPEDIDWQPFNDPCTLELGSDWHIPSYTEWNNVNGNGNWTNWTGPWNSNLKLHAAGFIQINGSLQSRGSNGEYWSNTQDNPGTGYSLLFNSGNSSIGPAGLIKSYGVSLRCLRETCAAPPNVPTSGTHVPSQTQIIWNWNPVTGATGYKWNTTNNYGSATDMGTVTTTTETGLTCNTTYNRYIWAYSGCGVSTATTLIGTTSACNTPGMPCPGTPTVTYGGKTYNTVQIGTQCWLKENLNIGTRINGSQEQTSNGVIEKYCYNNDEANCAIYGGLYQWGEMMQYVTTPGIKGICPSGWHIPTGGEWTTLTTFLGGESVAGGKMKSTGTIEAGTGLWYSPNAGATNESGFTGFPGGSRGVDGSFSLKGMYGNWWDSDSWPSAMELMYNNTSFHGFSLFQGTEPLGFSVRCLRDGSSAIASVTTAAVTNITATTATSGGTVTSEGGSPVTVRGVCWSTSSNPTTANSHTTDGSGIGSFTSNITGLTANTPYYVRAYATNSLGTSYGSQVSFTTTGGSVGLPCPGMPTIVYGGQTYNTVQIGAQCWLRENLNIGTRINGSQEQTNNGVIEKYCYDNLESNCDIYGGLYQWNEMMQYVTTPGVMGICPTGWHIPMDGEWCTITQFLDPTVNCSATGLSGTNAGGKMKEAGFSHWLSPNTGATNESGFTAVPDGYRSNEGGTFNSIGIDGYWWSSSEGGTDYAWFRILDSYESSVYRSNNYIYWGVSVRCLKDPCSSPPNTPTSGTNNPSQTQVIWNWNPVTGATGYKWNTTNNYASATDMGTATTTTETGLICNTAYTRYVWAYNSCGYSTPVSLAQTTSSCSFTCGSSIIINHVAGVVAPVTKTVTYGTVTNIPGETSKCWITRNLGASQQATAVNDATEASAGWYWQFNRKQGYKHDGATRTPNTTWNSIWEDLNWEAANDPCSIELGGGWRLPTYTEWNNVNSSGGWTSWWGPWSSSLKIHAAGSLDYYDGSLSSRGSSGAYWSSMQFNTSTFSGWAILFDSGYCFMSNDGKANGHSLRCIKQ